MLLRQAIRLNVSMSPAKFLACPDPLLQSEIKKSSRKP